MIVADSFFVLCFPRDAILSKSFVHRRALYVSRWEASEREEHEAWLVPRPIEHRYATNFAPTESSAFPKKCLFMYTQSVFKGSW